MAFGMVTVYPATSGLQGPAAFAEIEAWNRRLEERKNALNRRAATSPTTTRSHSCCRPITRIFDLPAALPVAVRAVVPAVVPAAVPAMVPTAVLAAMPAAVAEPTAVPAAMPAAVKQQLQAVEKAGKNCGFSPAMCAAMTQNQPAVPVASLEPVQLQQHPEFSSALDRPSGCNDNFLKDLEEELRRAEASLLPAAIGCRSLSLASTLPTAAKPGQAADDAAKATKDLQQFAALHTAPDLQKLEQELSEASAALQHQLKKPSINEPAAPENYSSLSAEPARSSITANDQTTFADLCGSPGPMRSSVNDAIASENHLLSSLAAARSSISTGSPTAFAGSWGPHGPERSSVSDGTAMVGFLSSTGPERTSISDAATMPRSWVSPGPEGPCCHQRTSVSDTAATPKHSFGSPVPEGPEGHERTNISDPAAAMPRHSWPSPGPERPCGHEATSISQAAAMPRHSWPSPGPRRPCGYEGTRVTDSAAMARHSWASPGPERRESYERTPDPSRHSWASPGPVGPCGHERTSISDAVAMPRSCASPLPSRSSISANEQATLADLCGSTGPMRSSVSDATALDNHLLSSLAAARSSISTGSPAAFADSWGPHGPERSSVSDGTAMVGFLSSIVPERTSISDAAAMPGPEGPCGHQRTSVSDAAAMPRHSFGSRGPEGPGNHERTSISDPSAAMPRNSWPTPGPERFCGHEGTSISHAAAMPRHSWPSPGPRRPCGHEGTGVTDSAAMARHSWASPGPERRESYERTPDPSGPSWTSPGSGICGAGPLPCEGARVVGSCASGPLPCNKGGLRSAGRSAGPLPQERRHGGKPRHTEPQKKDLRARLIPHFKELEAAVRELRYTEASMDGISNRIGVPQHLGGSNIMEDLLHLEVLCRAAEGHQERQKTKAKRRSRISDGDAPVLAGHSWSPSGRSSSHGAQLAQHASMGIRTPEAEVLANHGHHSPLPARPCSGEQAGLESHSWSTSGHRRSSIREGDAPKLAGRPRSSPRSARMSINDAKALVDHSQRSPLRESPQIREKPMIGSVVVDVPRGVQSPLRSSISDDSEVSVSVGHPHSSPGLARESIDDPVELLDHGQNSPLPARSRSSISDQAGLESHLWSTPGQPRDDTPRSGASGRPSRPSISDGGASLLAGRADLPAASVNELRHPPLPESGTAAVPRGARSSPRRSSASKSNSAALAGMLSLPGPAGPSIRGSDASVPAGHPRSSPGSARASINDPKAPAKDVVDGASANGAAGNSLVVPLFSVSPALASHTPSSHRSEEPYSFSDRAPPPAALFDCAEHGAIQQMLQLVSSRADINARDSSGRTSLQVLQERSRKSVGMESLPSRPSGQPDALAWEAS